MSVGGERQASLALSLGLAVMCAACASQRAPTIHSGASRSGPSIFDVLSPPPRPRARRSEPVVPEVRTYPPFDLDGALDAAGVPASAPDDSESIGAARGSTPAPTAAGDFRTVRITSNPPGARVYLGDRTLGVTPLSVRAPADDIWVLRVQRSGYHPGWVTIPSPTSDARVVLSRELEIDAVRPTGPPSPCDRIVAAPCHPFE